jgi:soluble lytic murein transglycosylase-like protein
MELKVTNELKQFKTTPEIETHKSGEKAKLEKAAKEFESLFTSMMLKSMTKTTNGMFGEDSFGGDMFSSIFENEIASEISKGKGIGIADFIYKQLENKYLKNQPSTEKTNSIDKTELKKNIKDSPIIPSKRSLNRIGKYTDIIDEAADTYGVDSNVIRSVILTESAGNEKAISGVKAKGLMQLMDSTAEDMGVKNIWDPKENIFGGTKYLSQMLRQYNGDLKLALASYNAGPGNVEKYDGIPPFEETKNYINRVLGYLNHLNG